MQTYVVIIEYYDLPRNGSYGAFVPDVPGCVATGKNIEQALERIRYTLTHFLRATTNAGQPIPLAHSLREHEEQYGCVGEALLEGNSIVAMVGVPELYSHITRAA